MVSKGERKVKVKNKELEVVAILVYKMAVMNTNLQMCPLDSLTSKMYS